MIIVEVSGDTPGPGLPPVRPRPGHPLQLVLTGVDGSEWDLNDGPVYAMSGISGLGSAKPEHRWKDAPAVDGSVWAGSRTPRRQPVIPVKIEAPDELTFRDIDAAFFDAIDPSGECELMVVTPDAQRRTLRMRYSDGADSEFEDDPLLMFRARYALEFTAADPFWQGDSITRSFGIGDPEPLFPGPPFHITPSNVLGSATAVNNGDVDTWPIWTVTGPFDQFVVGFGESRVVWSGPVALGDSVTIDMRPRMLTIRDSSGADRWGNTTEVNFAALPPGDSIPLSLALSGADANTRIAVTYTPRHRRAW